MSRAYGQRGAFYKSGRVVRLFATATFGAAGAVDSYSVEGGGTIVDSGVTGKYTLTLADKYSSFKHASFCQKDDGDALIWSVASEDVDGTKVLNIECKDDASALLDPTSGHIVTMEIVLDETSGG